MWSRGVGSVPPPQASSGLRWPPDASQPLWELRNYAYSDPTTEASCWDSEEGTIVRDGSEILVYAASVVVVSDDLFVEPVVERLPPAPSHRVSRSWFSSIGVRTQVPRTPAVADIAPARSAPRHRALGWNRPQRLVGLHGSECSRARPHGIPQDSAGPVDEMSHPG